MAIFGEKKSLNRAFLHSSNVEYGTERIRNKVKGSKVTFDFDDEDCFIDVVEKNGNLWTFDIDFGTGHVYMLEPREDRGSFGSDNEAFNVIISMLQGKRFGESASDNGFLLKESKDSDFFNAIAKKYHFSKDEKTRYKDKTYISAIGAMFDRVKKTNPHKDAWYGAMNDLWECIQTAKENGFDVSYEEKQYDKIIMTPDYNESLKESSKTDRLLELAWDGLVTKGEYDVDERLSLYDFEGGLTDNSIFYVKPSAFDKFPQKRPSTNTWNCKGLVKWHDGDWKDITIACSLPQDYVLESMGIEWDDIDSKMLLVKYVFLD